MPGATLIVEGTRSYPFLLLGLSGIIYSGIDDLVFTSPRAIDRLFEAIESIDGFSIEVSDLWLPVYSLPKRKPIRGDVFRIELASFQLAFRFRHGRMIPEELFEQTERIRQDLRYSAEETWAFREWERGIIEDVKARFPKSARLRLRRHDDDHPDPGTTADLPPLDPQGGGDVKNEGELLREYVQEDAPKQQQQMRYL